MLSAPERESKRKEKYMAKQIVTGLSVLVVVTLVTLTFSPVRAAEIKKGGKSACITCHEKVTPGIVKQFLSGKMGKTMDCSGCHGKEHMSAKDVAKVKLPTPDTCAICHASRVKEYREGKHALAWTAMKAMPMITHQPMAVGGGDLKGCSACHKVGEKAASELKRYGSTSRSQGSARLPDLPHGLRPSPVGDVADLQAWQHLGDGADHRPCPYLPDLPHAGRQT